jgi:hypothetical protein
LKRHALALAGWLLLALPAWAADPAVKAELSGPKAADPGGLFVLNPAGTVAPGGMKFGILKDAPGPVPITTLKSDDGQTTYGLAVAEKPGRYTFFVVAIGPTPSAGKLPEFDFAFWTVQVGEPPPPDPPPTPPAPNDPLFGPLQAAYAADADPQKAQQKASLAAFYRQSGATAQNAAVATWGALFDAMAQASQTLGIAGKLPGVSQVIQGEFQKTLNVQRAAPLDAAGRAKAADAFKRVAALLEAVK